MDEMRFDGRVAIVTGAGGGLGREYALLLASRGAKVVVNDLGTSRYGEGSDAGLAGKVVDEIRAAGGEAVANGSSVASREGCAAIARTALDNYGSIDILIHNATINRPGPFRDMTYEDFSEVLDVHVGGAFHLAKEAFPRMCDAGYGRIVLVSSIAGLYGDRNIAAYSTGKGAVIGLANALALEGADHGVTANCIVPAAQTRLAEGRDTDGFPPWGPDLVAPAAGWLAHESCPANGQLFVALAGRMAHAYVAETRGVYQPEWTIEDVAGRAGEIADRSDQQVFSPVPRGFYDHLEYSFGMAKGG
ncbi:MAG: SDR family NAD(P)-dependent oxidoreductase [Novosphingobium sp.]|nr:SDR family NAD(P)-dependent oxidoreductase [Novosphingobium sp.]MCP5404019.1 SDR family NAD(P)-dependent oxidoreductase [Novosphingobium sp.]